MEANVKFKLFLLLLLIASALTQPKTTRGYDTYKSYHHQSKGTGINIAGHAAIQFKIDATRASFHISEFETEMIKAQIALRKKVKNFPNLITRINDASDIIKETLENWRQKARAIVNLVEELPIAHIQSNRLRRHAASSTVYLHTDRMLGQGIQLPIKTEKDNIKRMKRLIISLFSTYGPSVSSIRRMRHKINELGSAMVNNTREIKRFIELQANITFKQQMVNEYIDTLNALLSRHIAFYAEFLDTFQTLLHNKLPFTVFKHVNITFTYERLQHRLNDLNLKMPPVDLHWLINQPITLERSKVDSITQLFITATISIPIFDTNNKIVIIKYRPLPYALSPTRVATIYDKQQRNHMILEAEPGRDQHKFYATLTEQQFLDMCHTIKRRKYCLTTQKLHHFHESCLGSIYIENITGIMTYCNVDLQQRAFAVQKLDRNSIFVDAPDNMTVTITCPTEKFIREIQGIQQIDLHEDCSFHSRFGSIIPNPPTIVETWEEEETHDQNDEWFITYTNQVHSKLGNHSLNMQFEQLEPVQIQASTPATIMYAVIALIVATTVAVIMAIFCTMICCCRFKA